MILSHRFYDFVKTFRHLSMASSVALTKYAAIGFLGMLSLQSCAPVLVVGGVSTLSLAAQDQGIQGAVSDKEIKLSLKGELFDSEKGFDLFNRVDINVFEGNVLLTGFVSSQEAKTKVGDMAENTNGVRAVFNELGIGEEQGLGSASSDTWISTKIRTELFLTHNLRSANFLIHTTDGVVYLMGVAQNQAELDQVLDIIRETSGVQRVVDMTRLADEPLPPAREITKKSGPGASGETTRKPHVQVEKRYGGSQSATYGLDSAGYGLGSDAVIQSQDLEAPHV